MQLETFDRLNYTKQWDGEREQFYKTPVHYLRVYEGGYVTYDRDPQRDPNHTHWLWFQDCFIGTTDELPDDIRSNLTTPDGERVLAADLNQRATAILLCDKTHRVAVALDGMWKEKVGGRRPRVYWPSVTARPISAWDIMVSRANRKTSNLMKKRRDDAANLLWATMQMHGLKQMIYAYQGWDHVVSQVIWGKVTGEELLENYLGVERGMDKIVQLESTLRRTKEAITNQSRDVVHVPYLKF